MEYSPSWEDCGRSASEGIPRLFNLKLRCCVRKSSQPVPTVSQTQSSAYTLTTFRKYLYFI
jgi:hypothetical protein